MSELPARADVVIIGGGAVGASTAFHLATGGVAGRGRARARDARQRLHLALGRRRAPAVRRRAQRAAVAAQPRRVRALGHADRRARRVRARHRVPPERLSLPARQRGRRRDVPRGARRAALPGRAVARADSGRGARDRAADGARRRARGDLLPARRLHEPRGGRAGLRGGGRRARRARLQGCPATGIEHAGGRITGVRTAQGTIATDTVVCAAGAWSQGRRRHGRPRHPGARRATPHVVLARARRPARRPAADDRLHARASTSTPRGRASSSADARSSSRMSPSTRSSASR